MELLPLLLLIPMLWIGLVLFAFGLHGLIGLLGDGQTASLRKAGRYGGAALLLLFGNGLALESLRPMLPANTALMPCLVLVAISGGIFTAVLSRLHAPRSRRRTSLV